MRIDVWDERTGEHEVVESRDAAERVVERMLGAPVGELDVAGISSEQTYLVPGETEGVRVTPRWEWT